MGIVIFIIIAVIVIIVGVIVFNAATANHCPVWRTDGKGCHLEYMRQTDVPPKSIPPSPVSDEHKTKYCTSGDFGSCPKYYPPIRK